MRELIDHPPYIVDLPDDGVSALFEHAAIFIDHLSVLATQAFGRQLNRCQGIFYFVRDTARDVGPC